VTPEESAVIESARRRDRPTATAAVSRRPVVDAQLRVVGYRVAYALLGEPGGDSGRAAPSADDALQLFDDALSVVGLDELVGPSVAHLPISREFLLALGVPPVRPDRVLLTLAHDEAGQPEVLKVLERLSFRGYALELSGLPAPEFDYGLLDVFGSVSIDFSAWNEAEIALALPRVLERRARPVASNIREHDQYEWARGRGFELFDGSFYAKPRLHAVRSFGVDRSSIASLIELQSSGTDVDTVVGIVEHDVGLSVKLLRYLNSAYLARRGTISSIRQAVMMLGTRGVAQWALLLALTTGPDTPRELSMIALTRARLCRSLGEGQAGVESEELFAVGLLSIADALLGAPLAEVLAELPLAEHTRDALIDRTGAAGEILEAVLGYERGEFDLPRLRAEGATLLERYREALRWADATISAVA
jgi:EAL and modified HD-GYP domain-containing signal transduction protein